MKINCYKIQNNFFNVFSLILFILLFILPNYSFALENHKNEKKIIQEPKESQLNEYREKDAFQYDENFVPPQTIWQKIMYYIAKFFNLLFSDKGIAPYIRWSIVLLLFIIVIVKLINAKFSNLFYSSKQKIVDDDIIFNEKGENIENINEKISSAIESEKYREATRLLYVKALKLLRVNDLIQWEANKTNNDFRSELNNTIFEKLYSVVSYWFEYVWYGKFYIDNSVFERIMSDYDRLFNLINEKDKKK